MKVLHICSDFCYTNLYFKLVEALDKKGVDQIIYVPLKKGRVCDNFEKLKDSLKNLNNVTFISSSILSKDLRFRYFTKINTIFKDIECKVDLKTIDITHAHFLYSDGGVAYKIKEKYNIPFITAVRNTDVNVFYKYFIHCRSFAGKILNESKNIIFISPSYQSFLKKPTFGKNIKSLTAKTKIIPNGINDFWFEESISAKKLSLSKLNFVFVGELSANKNIHGAISFLKEYKNRNNVDIAFSIVGPESNYTTEVLDMIKTNKWVTYLGAIYDKQKLKEIFKRSDIFIMLSKKETFGLVYIEAMSQGLPVIYTKNQGIEGYFKENSVGVSVDITALKNEVDKISVITDNYDVISNNSYQNSRAFNWFDVSEKYREIYLVK